MVDPPEPAPFASADELARALAAVGYLADPALALSLWLALRLGRPLFVEGPAGVGKTQLARASAEALGRELVRLQCYEGLDEAKALYEWDYAKQMLFAQLARAAAERDLAGVGLEGAVKALARGGASFFGEEFLVARPLLAALRSDAPCVLLVDEVDRADPEFEALLLEVLADMQVTVPEIGTLRAKHVPLVVLTSNGTRDMTEALRRRCLHAFVDYPAPAREVEILRRAVPGIEAALAEAIARLLRSLRALDLQKHPSVAEAIDFASALALLGRRALDAELVRETLGVLVKHKADRDAVEPRVEALVRAANDPG